VKCNI